MQETKEEPKKNLPWIFLCHGASNTGQMANDAAKDIYREGKAKVGCIAAIGSRAEAFIAPNKSGRRVICVDGCPTKCASKTLGFAEISPASCLVVTELGLKKSMDMMYTKEEVEKVKKAIEAIL